MKVKACPQIGHYHNRHYRKQMLTQTSNKGKGKGLQHLYMLLTNEGGALTASVLCTMPSAR